MKTKLSVFLVLTILFSCKQYEMDDELLPDPDQVVIAEEAIVISEQLWEDYLQSFDSLEYTVTFSPNLPVQDKIQTGSIIVSSVGEGFIRRVSSVERVGSGIIVYTEEASLTDAIKQGKIELDTVLTVDQIESIEYYNDGIQVDSSVLKGSGKEFGWNINTPITKNIKIVGNFSCNYRFNAFIDIGLIKGLKEADFGFTLDETLILKLLADLEFSFEREIQLIKIKFTPIIVPTGIIPVVFTPQLVLYAGINGSANSAISTGINQSFFLNVGVKYFKEEGWSPYKRVEKNLNFQPPMLTANAESQAYLNPEFPVKVMGLAGPYADLKIYGSLEADVNKTPWWEFYGGMELGIGGKFKILDDLIDFDVYYKIFDIRRLLAEAKLPPISEPDVTTNQVTSITTSSAQVGGNIISDGGTNLIEKGVYWGKISNPQNTGVKKVIGGASTIFSATITGLTPNTQYYVVSFARNSKGTSFGNQLTFTTKGNPPDARFTSSSTRTTEGKNIQFTDQSTNSPTRWSWNFGDGRSSSERNPSHAYSKAGTYTVSLTVSNNHGTDTDTKTNYITVTVAGKPPVAAFTASPRNITEGQSVQFTDESTNSPTSWSWNFGDGQSSTQRNPSHTYSAAGTYTVSLTTTNQLGTDTETKSNYITVTVAGSPPVAAFTASPRNITEGQSVQFTDESTNSPTSWSWNFGDGQSSTQRNPSHTYSAAGNYNVSLTVTNQLGTDTETKSSYITVTVAGSPPVAAFTASPRNITEGQSVQFTDESTNSPTSWSWNFGDGQSSTQRNPSHTYSAAGTYTVSLTTTNQLGTDTETKSNYITVTVTGNPPVANFNASKTYGQAPTFIQFTDLSSNSPTSWLWEFGDGQSSSMQNPEHYYEPGVYTITLTVSNQYGTDVEQKIDYIELIPIVLPPIAEFSATPTSILAGETVSFTDESYGASTWSWDFGDGQTSTNRHPNHVYENAGTYSVTLTVTNNQGLQSDTQTKSNYIQVSSNISCYPNLSSPILQYTGSENYNDAYGDPYTRYNLSVTNYSQFPDNIFVLAPHLPPCGSNTNASRTWVDIYDNNDNRLYGFCGFTEASLLSDIHFFKPLGESPPSSVYIVISDRECNVSYRSNLISIPQ